MERTYAQVIGRAVRKGEPEDALLKRLFAHLEVTGRMKLLPGILRELRAQVKHARKQAPVLEVASTDEEARARAEGANAKTVVVNEALVSGWRERSGSSLTDRSGKTALVEIYRNIVTK